MCKRFILLASLVSVLGLVSHARGQVATNPSPADGAVVANTWVGLGWSKGETAASHDVYFGENSADVSDGTGGTFQGNQATTNLIVGFPGFAYPGGLVPGTTYYWRVDEVEADGTTIHKGDLWSLAIAPEQAYGPNQAQATPPASLSMGRLITGESMSLMA